MENRFPIFDISPQVTYADRIVPTKAICAESINVRATIIREGHEKFEASVCLVDPDGAEVGRSTMREYWPGTDRFETEIRPSTRGIWYFYVEVKSLDGKLKSQSPKYPINVERDRSLYGSWYEFFVRSEGASRTKSGEILSGNFQTATKSLTRIAEMGFDVIYLPPIHPIGITKRKGRNNTLPASAKDPGVPWAIGNSDGGHDAIDPSLGGISDFEHFIARARDLGLEVAMDFALQCSPDHPWVKEHREWFTEKPDGSIAFAENPPKKYEDIYPINLDNDYEGLLAECYRILEYWITKGIHIFRVDNPHTKPVQFWHDVIKQINSAWPDVIFLSEAFTRPPMMYELGKAGFQQSYTYFTWRVAKQELIDYGSELSRERSAYFRPNFWVNTPDILPFHLQSGAPSIFAMRALLAGTMSASWGMYCGYELYEHLPLREGAEEYLDSEKYEIKIRDWSKPSLAPFISKLNAIRKQNTALQRVRNLRFHNSDSEHVLAYSKRDIDNLILVIVNLDPLRSHECLVHWDFFELGIPEGKFEVEELITKNSFEFTPHTYIKIDPAAPGNLVGMICKVKL